MKRPIRLVQIAHGGVPAEDLGSLPEVATEMCAATVSLYRKVGFNPPWVGYLALSGSDVVDTCSFVSQPQGGKVEIAYFTFPPFEGQGIATAMAQALIEIAGKADREIEVTARTLPVPKRLQRHPAQARIRMVRSCGRPGGRKILGVASSSR